MSFNNIDWGAIATNAVKAYATVAVARNTLAVQRAQQEAALRAQAAEWQAMQRRAAQTPAQPADGGVLLAPAGKRPQSNSPFDNLPPWVVPAGVGVLVLLLLRR